MTTDLPTRSSGAQRRHELGAFLRSRREHLSCADVGLVGTARRRTPGLRREEVAMLAGISTTWLSYLEQGRDVQASRQVLDALANALQLAPAERTYLFDLTSHAPPPPAATHLLAPAVTSVTQALEPNPAYVTAGDFEVLAWNEAAARLFPGLVGEDGRRPNVARWLFCDPDAQQVLLDWEPVAQDVLARLRAAAGRHPDDHRYLDLVAELRAASPYARSWWPRHDVRASTAGRKRVRHRGRGVLDLAYATFSVAGHPEQTLVVYLDDGRR